MSDKTKDDATAKQKLIAFRLTAAELARIDAAAARFASGVLPLSRSDILRLTISLGLEQMEAMSADEIGRVVFSAR